MLEVSIGLLLVGSVLISLAHYLVKLDRELHGK